MVAIVARGVIVAILAKERNPITQGIPVILKILNILEVIQNVAIQAETVLVTPVVDKVGTADTVTPAMVVASAVAVVSVAEVGEAAAQ